jgi:predicted SprT family Zn-dependent metalloprotease
MAAAKLKTNQHSKLTTAYNHFNRTLFGNKLPNAVIILKKAAAGNNGHFWADQWKRIDGEAVTAEISLNPSTFGKQSQEEIMATLVHEMVHFWQHENGKPSANGYHNKEWGDMMEAVGLMPSNTGREGGKRTGRQMTHYIIEGGKFDQACSTLLKASPEILTWEARPETRKQKKVRKVKKASKTKFTCPSCQANAWGKPDLLIGCVSCAKVMKAQS